MKKLLVTILAAFMIFAVAGSAAAWSDGTLTASIYAGPSGYKEVGLNLGSIDNLNRVDVTLAAAGSINANDFFLANSLDQLKVGVFGQNAAGNIRLFATTSEIVPTIQMANAASYNTAAYLVANNYGTGSKSVIDKDNRNSYWKKMNKNGTSVGRYAGFNRDFTNGEAALSTTGYVDMYLYMFDLDAIVKSSKNAFQHAVLRFNTDGSIVLNPEGIPTGVPVPGAVILLGSGLLGLVGIRRKK